MIPTLTQEQIEELEAKHGKEIYSCDTPQGILYFHCPSKGEFQRAAQVASNKDAALTQKLIAQEMLCLSCVVYPNPTDLRALFERFYTFSEVIVDAISKVIKGDETARVGKSVSASS
jgi:hypothetical protein